MSDKRRPWFKFYPSDWQADVDLGRCSLGARGLWMELLSIMHKSNEYGHLLVSGTKPDSKTLAFLCRNERKTVEKYLQELKKNNVFSVSENGVIFSRRMVSDQRKYMNDKYNGNEGGNPDLKKKMPQGVNPPVNPGDKAKSIEDRIIEKNKKDSVPTGLPTAAPSADPVDVRTELFREGLDIMIRLTGKSEGSCRSFLGKALKEAKDDCALVLNVLREALKARPADVAPWIVAGIKNGLAKPMSAKERVLARYVASRALDSLEKTHKDVPTMIEGWAESVENVENN